MTERDLTEGNITSSLWAFAVPLMLGNVMQQLYNLVDTWVVGKYIGAGALAAVGSSYTLMTFLTSVIIGLCLGAGAYISIAFGRKKREEIRSGVFMSFVLIGGLSVVIMVAFYSCLDGVISLLQVPAEITAEMREYLFWVFWGFFAAFLYNHISAVLRGLGNSVAPLLFLGVSVALNIFLDLYFVAVLGMGIRGAAVATVISQHVSGIGVLIYFWLLYPAYRPSRSDMGWQHKRMKNILSLSGFTCLQQSVMNFGILAVQGIVNGFGAVVMAAFAVAVKIDTLAYMPVQDFGNAFSVFVAQNFGANKFARIKAGVRQSLLSVAVFSLCVSAFVFAFAEELMEIFVPESGAAVIAEGARYLKIEGAFYIGIGVLFMLYGYYRAVNKPQMSVVLTICSLGTRVLLAYVLSRVPQIGVVGIWAAIPIGWIFADAVGIAYYCRKNL